MTPDQWVVIGYPGKNKNSKLNYIGHITKVLSHIKIIEVKFVKKQPGGGRNFKFPDVDQLDHVSFDYVIEFLKEPVVNNRQQLTFPGMRSIVLR